MVEEMWPPAAFGDHETDPAMGLQIRPRTPTESVAGAFHRWRPMALDEGSHQHAAVGKSIGSGEAVDHGRLRSSIFLSRAGARGDRRPPSAVRKLLKKQGRSPSCVIYRAKP